MISIIVCSRNEQLCNLLRKNIAETIGTEHELISIDNASNRYSICEAYNQGAASARYPYLCFLHEDVKLHTTGWGVHLVKHFETATEVGVIGVAGSTYKIRMVSSWWQPEILHVEPKRVNFIQHYKHTNQAQQHMYLNPFNEERSRVATVDGVFMAVKRERWQQFHFDDWLLKGFHGYDLDFSLRTGSRYNNYVVFDILLEHYSEGVNDGDWLAENFLVHRKNKSLLPVIINSANVSTADLKPIERSYLQHNLELAKEASFSKTKLLLLFPQLIWNSRLLKPDLPFLKQWVKALILT